MSTNNNARNLEAKITKLFEIAKVLATQYNLSIITILKSREGLKQFSTPAVGAKYEKSQECSTCNQEGSWTAAFNKDSLDLSRNLINPEDLVKTVGTFELPAKVNLLHFNEALELVRVCILRNHKKHGRKGNMIQYGKPYWEPEFWKFKSYHWPWLEVKNFKHLKVSEFNGTKKIYNYFGGFSFIFK